MTHSNSDLPKLSAPAQRALAAAGITTLKQVSEMSEKALLQLHGIGPNAIKTLREALAKKGMGLKGDEETQPGKSLQIG